MNNIFIPWGSRKQRNLKQKNRGVGNLAFRNNVIESSDKHLTAALPVQQFLFAAIVVVKDWIAI